MAKKNIFTVFALFFFISLIGQSNPNQQEENKEPEGPKNMPIQLFDQLKSDYDFGNNYFDILNVNGQVYEDINPKSGHYYYFPKEYQLSWSAARGYNFTLNYLSATSSGEGQVVITLELLPNISQSDVELTKSLLKNALKDRDNRTFKVLNPIPLSEASKISFQRLEGLIDSRDIEITVPNDFLDPIVLILKTNRPDDLLTLLFTETGLRGNLSIYPDGDIPAQILPITIKFDYNKTFGTIDLNPISWRADGWKNSSEYPVIAKNLHILKMEKSLGKEIPKIYTWNMGDKEISEFSSLKFDATAVPKWLDSDRSVKKMWIEYAVKACDDCDAEIRKSILNARPGSQITYVSFDVHDPLEASGAVKMRIKARSIQMAPNAIQKIEINPPYSVLQDGVTLDRFQLFVPENKKPEFEYSISLVMDDGDIVESGWISNKGKTEIGIGRNFIKDHFPEYSRLEPVKPKRGRGYVPKYKN